MKKQIKLFLSRLGCFAILDLIRRIPAIIRWINTGCMGVAPSPIKRIILTSYLDRYNLKHFVETGTHNGDTLAFIANNKSIQSVSIELDSSFYEAAQNRFFGYPNVTLLQGDSANLLPEYVQKLKSPTLFWLDGHFSGADTAKGETNTPIWAELNAILNSTVKGHVILIDDAHCFDGTHDYPSLDRLLETIRNMRQYEIEISTDIIRLTPKQEFP